MNTPQRLFDCLAARLEQNKDQIMFGYKEGGIWKSYTVQESVNLVNNLAAGLVAKGISRYEPDIESKYKIAVICKNRPEWLLLDMAAQKIGAALVPVYPTISIGELEFVLNDAAIKMVFVNDESLFLKVQSIKGNLVSQPEVYTFEHVANAQHWKNILALSTPLRKSYVEEIAAQVKYEDVATIIYTSGTTGTPKGVMLQHKNILSNVIACLPCFPPGNDLKALSFLPLNHIFEKMVSYVYLFKGTSIYYAENLDTIGDNLKEVQPHLFTTVPRLLEKVYDKIMAAGSTLTGIKRNLFLWAHSLAEKFEINKPLGLGYKMQLALADKIIFNKWRAALGGNVLCIVTGGAACQVRLIRIFTAAGITIMEGYGLTETSPVIAVNRYDEANRKFGTVGPLISGVSVKIAEDGEILCKGPNIMPGYYKRPCLTAEAIQNEWFHTGDIGILDSNNFLSITDRKKEMFKTSGGKYVAPLAIENKMKESPFIEQIMVVGAEKKFVGAIIIPAFEYLKKWGRENKIDASTNEQLIANEAVKNLYKDVVASLNTQFSHVEQIKKFELLPCEWSIDTGELTPKLSMKRKVIVEKYKEYIEHIYA